MQPDHSLWKIVFGFMIMVAGLVFMGALAMSDADIFNVEMARAEAERLSSQTAYEAQKGRSTSPSTRNWRWRGAWPRSG